MAWPPLERTTVPGVAALTMAAWKADPVDVETYSR